MPDWQYSTTGLACANSCAGGNVRQRDIDGTSHVRTGKLGGFAHIHHQYIGRQCRGLACTGQQPGNEIEHAALIESIAAPGCMQAR
jgi:hypothetical protein